MAPRFHLLLPALLLLAALPGVLAQDRAADREEPARSDLVERAQSRLVQVDVTVTGPAQVVDALTAEDFRVKLGFKRLREFTIDRYCPDAPIEGPEEREEPRGRKASPAAAVPNLARPASYVFYLDQPHLTIEGRVRALGMTGELIERLVRGGNRGMLVSNARELAIVQPFTTDAGLLSSRLKELHDDLSQWDSYSSFETNRLEEILTQLDVGFDVNAAISRARTYQREERSVAQRNLRRLETVVTRLATLPAPKALIYFADTMRSNAGEHYLSFFADDVSLPDTDPALAAMRADSFGAGLAFDRVVNQAAAQGVRFYPVQAEGLASQFLSRGIGQLGAERARSAAYSPRTRIIHAQNTLASLAAETGGEAFLNASSSRHVADTILSDFSCFFLLSFRPVGYTLDAPHRLVVEVDRPQVQVRSRGRFVYLSDEARLTAQLTSAFALPGEPDGELDISGALIPTGFADGRYTALAQIRVPGVELNDTHWDMGGSVVQGSSVRHEFSSRLQVPSAGVPMVLEREVRVAPGPHELVSVAHESRTNTVLSGQTLGDWPRPGPKAAISPVSLLQPIDGLFVRDDVVRTNGSFAVAAEFGVDPGRPVALVGVVCRAKSRRGGWRVERELHGASSVDFPAIDLPGDGERCQQIRDLIPADKLGPGGAYRYEIRLVRDGSTLAEAERSFRTVASPQPSAATGG